MDGNENKDFKSKENKKECGYKLTRQRRVYFFDNNPQKISLEDFLKESELGIHDSFLKTHKNNLLIKDEFQFVCKK